MYKDTTHQLILFLDEIFSFGKKKYIVKLFFCNKFYPWYRMMCEVLRSKDPSLAWWGTVPPSPPRFSGLGSLKTDENICKAVFTKKHSLGLGCSYIPFLSNSHFKMKTN